MQRIIGLDIGSYSIKAVEIVNSFQSYEIVGFYENVIPFGGDLAADLPGHIDRIFKENRLEADRIVTAMPGQYISSRILTFNFSDPRKIASAVLPEVEDVVPYNIDDMIIDHQILGHQDGKTLVLVVLTRKTYLASFLDNLIKVGIDPKLVDIDSLAFYNLAPAMNLEAGKVYGLVDIGHEKTSVCLVQDGVLRMFRAINLGGRYVTDFLAADLDVTYDQAQQTKHRIGRVCLEHEATWEKGTDNYIAERMSLGFRSLFKDLGRTLYAFKTWEREPVEKIFISGGSSQIVDFDKLLAEHLDIPVEINNLNDTSLKMKDNLVQQAPVMAQGIAVGLRAVVGIKRHSSVNLRKDEFAYVQDYESVLRSISSVASLFTAALIMLMISYGVFFFIYSKQIDNVRKAFKSQVVDVLPDMKKKFLGDRVSFAKIKKDSQTELKSRAADRKAAVDGFVSVNSSSPALVALRDVSAGLPDSVKVNVTEYKYTARPDGTGSLFLRVEADSYQTITSFKDAMEKIPALQEFEEKSSDSKPGSDIKVATFSANYISGLN